jgi:diguanylate cyclase
MIPPKAKQKILIIEDEAAMRKILVDTFTSENFAVFQAPDGETGLATALQEKPDIILLDIVLPRMDGLAVLNKLRSESPYGKNVPVILLTNLSPDSEAINQAITKDTPSYYLVKANWNIEDVVEKVRERLSRV